jgi:N-acetyl-anhydromuramoyl-L-alanine amidase
MESPLLSSTENTNFAVSPGAGLLRPASQCPSPNQDDRPDGVSPELVIIHGISLPPGEYGGPHIESLFTNCLDWNAHPYFQEIEGMQVSAHLLIRRNGDVIQFVPFERRAWHAGESSFRGRACCNDYSIGIELEGSDETPYADSQYTQLIGVIRAISEAYPQISAREIAGHCDVAPGRKLDPGPAFDWLRLYDGLGVDAGMNGTS